jgi:hypothetical protein
MGFNSAFKGLNVFDLGTGLANLLTDASTNSGPFAKKFFGVWIPEFTSTIFPNIPVTSLRPLSVGATGSCPACPLLQASGQLQERTALTPPPNPVKKSPGTH